MDMEEEILALAVALGQISESQQLRTLVRAAQLEWAGRLKEGVSPQDCASAFCIAAAWTALAGLEGVQTVARFSAGDLTVETGGNQSQNLRQMAEEVLRPYLRDVRFAFRGVRG